MRKIAIIDYGMGNLHSAAKALEKVGAMVTVTRDPAQVRKADQVVLPGVGAFGDCMKNLHERELAPVIHEVIAAGKPFLGICVGLQMLFEGSEEDPEVPGLGVFQGMVRKIKAPGLKIPHMGWNSLDLKKPSPLFRGLPPVSYVYFVHSFHAVPDDMGLLTAVTNYGESVTAAVGRDLVQAVQFHPEKSSAVGLRILQNFKEIAG
jgi:imidazole glycerol-phosphate synthase subunit HisH